MNLRLALPLLLASLAVPGAASSREPTAGPLLAVSTGGRIVVVDATGMHRRVLTDREDGRTVEPAWSPDGSRIAYVRFSHRKSAVFIVPADGGAARRLTRDFPTPSESIPWLGRPAWAPDGRRLAFTTPKSFYVASPDGSLRRIAAAPSEGDGDPHWLGNRLLAYCRGYSDSGVLLDVRTGRKTDVGGADCAERGPFWSADGTRYVLARGDSRGNAQLVVVDRRGDAAKLTNDLPLDREIAFDDCCARWSQDGSRLVFLSDRLGLLRRDAFVVGNDGTEERRLTWTGDVGEAALSGDDSTVGFVRGRTLWTLPLAGGRPRPIATHVEWGWSWQPQVNGTVRQPPVARVRVPPRRLRIHQAEYPFRPHRLVAVRRFAAGPAGEVDGISRNGAIVTFSTYEPHHRYGVGVIDLRRSRIRMLGFGLSPFYASAPLSPSGDAILLRRWTRLYRVDVATGRVALIARGAFGEAVGWLSRGRVRFVDGRGRLVDTAGAGRITPTGLTLPPHLRSYVSWSPGGRYVLYSRDCATWLRDLRTGKERRIAGPAIPGAWSPDGLRFLLTQASWDSHCTVPWTALWGGFSVRDIHGRAIFGYGSGFPAWSADGRFVTVNGGVSGTAVGYLQPLSILRLRTGTLVPLLRNRLDGTALAGPGGWILYSRFPANANPEGPPLRSSMYLARLAPRWR